MSGSSHYRRRFWKDVSLEAHQEGEVLLYRPLLDKRVITLPKGKILQISSYPLAKEIAQEWRIIKENSTFSAEELPLTRIAGTMIERIAPARQEVIESLCAYGQDDAFCYSNPAQNIEICEKIVSWLKNFSLTPKRTEALMPLEQEGAYLLRIRKILEGKNAFYLASLGVLSPLFGSLLISLALLDNILIEEEAFALGFADELYQLKIWGEDAELIHLLERRRKEMKDAVIFYHLSEVNDSIKDNHLLS